jgi:hypothetical protein
MQHIPRRGSAPALADVIGQHHLHARHSGHGATGCAAAPHGAGFFGLMCSMTEAGVKGFNEVGSDLWMGIVGPAGIPKPIVTRSTRR